MLRYREEVLSVYVSQVLNEYGIPSRSELLLSGRRSPDIFVHKLDGLRIVLEGKHEKNKRSLIEQAKRRLQEDIAEVCIAIEYPEHLFIVENPLEAVRNAVLKFHVLYWSEKGIEVHENEGNLYSLANVIKNVVKADLIKNDVLHQAIKKVDKELKEVAYRISLIKTTFFDASSVASVIGKQLKIESSKNIRDLWYILEFLLLDACIFHESISSSLGINSLSQAEKPYQRFLLAEWNKILKVDYRPIFNLSLTLLKNLPSSPETEWLLEKIITIAKDIVASGLIQRHDFMGRIYHKLLLNTTAEYYATYYTSVPASVLLSHLIVNTPYSDGRKMISSLEDLKEFKVLDPACGSGTLLQSIYSSIKSSLFTYEIPSEFHKVMLENVLYGFDVLDYATHLTLTTLALQNPKVKINKTQIATLFYGMSNDGHIYMGSLDLLRAFIHKGSGVVRTLEEDLLKKIDLGSFNVIIMNPPFSRSSKANVKYGFTDEEVSSKMRKVEKQIRSFYNLEKSGFAGITPLFVLLGFLYLKEWGRLGMVLPRAFLNSASWANVRKKLLDKCNLKYVISSFDPGPPQEDSWNWSENTNLGECLIIAEKIAEKGEKNEDTVFVNFVKKPRNHIVSIMCADFITSNLKNIPYLEDRRYEQRSIPEGSLFYVYKVKRKSIEVVDRHLQALCTFSHPEINAFILDLYYFIKSEEKFNSLSSYLEKDGVDIKSIRECFKESKEPTSYPIIWGKVKSMNTIKIDDRHIKFGIPEKDRSEKLHRTYASDLLLLERVHLNNDALVCFKTDKEVLATVMWELQLIDTLYEPLILLWLNSTFGMLLYLSLCENAGGSTFVFKKAKLPYLYIPNVEEDLSDVLTKFKNKPFKVFKDEDWQSTRKDLDDIFVQILEKDFKRAQDIKHLYPLISKDTIVR